jgi:hypothetical protein
VTLWTWDKDLLRIRENRSYFGRSHVNNTFPVRGEVEWQWTLGQIVTAVAAAGMEILHLGEYPEPFWHAGGVAAAARFRRPPAPLSSDGQQVVTSDPGDLRLLDPAVRLIAI